MVNVRYIDAGVERYQECLERQRAIFDPIVAEKIAEKEKTTASALILCEHPHVYTLGKNGEQQNLLITPDFLEQIDAEYYQTDRGGDITYHGPGQLVGYPILDLELLKIGLREYIEKLEITLINIVAQYGIESHHRDDATGVWIEADSRGGLRKISAIGVRSSRFVTMHGFALNVQPDMNYYNYINPCGFTDRSVTSIAQEIGKQVNLGELKRRYCKEFETMFGVRLT